MGINAGVQIPKWNRRKGRFLFWYGMRGAHDVRGKGIVTTWLTAGGCRIDDTASISPLLSIIMSQQSCFSEFIAQCSFTSEFMVITMESIQRLCFWHFPQKPIWNLKDQPLSVKTKCTWRMKKEIACKGTFTFYNVSSWFKTHTHYWRAKGVSAS